MKAIQVTQTGGQEVLMLADMPRPTAKPNEALIESSRVEARAKRPEDRLASEATLTKL